MGNYLLKKGKVSEINECRKVQVIFVDFSFLRQIFPNINHKLIKNNLFLFIQISSLNKSLCLSTVHITIKIADCFTYFDPKFEHLKYTFLSHNKPCFQCNTAITNFLVSNTCEIRFHDVIGQSTVPMYSYAKILKHG